MTGDLEKEYNVKRISVDNCNEITWSTEWVWVAVGLGCNELVKTIFLNILLIFSWWCSDNNLFHHDC